MVGRHKETGVEVALKVVFRRRPGLQGEHWNILRSEMVALVKCEHPNIISLLGQYEDSDILVLVLELLSGGEMLRHIQEIKHYTERQAAVLFSQISLALAHMHSKGYMHRDLKPENILFVHPPKDASDEELQVKVIDLGMSTVYNPNNPIRAALGTAGFLAPECCHRVPHTPAMDIWSLGVMLFVMLCGRMPYSHEQIENLYYPEIDIRRSPGYKSTRFRNLSQPAKDLLLGMLDRDPRLRFTADEVADHLWLSQLKVAASHHHENEHRLLVAGVTAGASSVGSRRNAKGMGNCAIVDDNPPTSTTDHGSVRIEISSEAAGWRPNHPKALSRKDLERHVELDADAFKKKDLSTKVSLNLAKEDMISSMKEFSEGLTSIVGKTGMLREVRRQSSEEPLVRLAAASDSSRAVPLAPISVTTTTSSNRLATAAAANGSDGGDCSVERLAAVNDARSEHKSEAKTDSVSGQVLLPDEEFSKG
eukprot:CAMPEP_0117662494 /NCGR_PEP_ID=MMETSP0804-20121206/8081_1 /TAXON_ID=1074897 /ORGANISM="Tetraselmis astigmatica, Strain CCMP880" /LENGTH=477 /DNA_ID=CAMNT_0005469393 /DNA_START=171 /DNA_END=1605 /DNA_ORIENTATION=-